MKKYIMRMILILTYPKPNYNPEPIDSIIQNEIEEIEEEIENIIEHTRKKSTRE